MCLVAAMVIFLATGRNCKDLEAALQTLAEEDLKVLVDLNLDDLKEDTLALNCADDISKLQELLALARTPGVEHGVEYPLPEWIMDPPIQISVKRVNNEEMTMTVQSSHTIEKVKREIQGQSGISPDKQRLIFAGKELEDGRTLASYNVGSEAKLCLAVEGVFKISVRGLRAGVRFWPGQIVLCVGLSTCRRTSRSLSSRAAGGAPQRWSPRTPSTRS